MIYCAALSDQASTPPTSVRCAAVNWPTYMRFCFGFRTIPIRRRDN
jgi:hypothetical protein